MSYPTNLENAQSDIENRAIYTQRLQNIGVLNADISNNNVSIKNIEYTT